MSITPAHAAGIAYVRHVNAGDLDGLVGLFAAYATVLHPLGTFQGVDAIREFYANNVLAHAPVLVAYDWVHDEPHCVFELAATVGERTSHAIDHLTVDGTGKIARMAIAYR